MEDQDENPALLEVAEAVSDGNPVDWELAQSRHDEAVAELSHLQALEVVATAHRSARLPGNTGDPSADVSESSRWDRHHAQAAQPQPTAAVPSGWRSPGLVRAVVGLGLALVALLLVLRFLWKP
jgi:hypothetical protein